MPGPPAVNVQGRKPELTIRAYRQVGFARARVHLIGALAFLVWMLAATEGFRGVHLAAIAGWGLLGIDGLRFWGRLDDLHMPAAESVFFICGLSALFGAPALLFVNANTAPPAYALAGMSLMLAFIELRRFPMRDDALARLAIEQRANVFE